MDEQVAIRIRNALVLAARMRQIVSYSEFHAFFEPTDSFPSRFRLLENVVRKLANPAEADYGCLMAGDGDVPGIEFFDGIVCTILWSTNL